MTALRRGLTTMGDKGWTMKKLRGESRIVASVVGKTLAMYLPVIVGLSACDGASSEIVSSQAEQLTVPKVDRNAEVAAWTARNHKAQGHRIVKTEVTPSGSIVDWVDRNTVDGSDAVPPPPLVSPSKSSGVASTGLEKLSGPPGTLPFIRPALLPFVNGKMAAVDVDDYLRQISQERALHGGPPTGNPIAGGGNRLYSGDILNSTNFGLSGYVNNFFSGTDSPSSPDFSIYELASYCFSGSTVSDLVGVIEGKHPQVYGSNTVIGAEYFSGGSQSWITGGGNKGAWHQVSTTKSPGITVTGPSIVNGAQGEYQLAVILFNSPRRWWLWMKDEWVGYFDTTQAFTTLDNSACTAQWYGEVYDPDHATTHWTSADSGSGILPNGSLFFNNFGSRGYLRQPIWYSVINNAGGTYMSTLNKSGGIDTSCYNVSLSTDGNSSWNPTLFFGGPGGNGTGCN